MSNRISSADPSPRVVSAADLRSGRVVYLDGSGQWTAELRLAQVARTDVGQRALLRVAAQAEAGNLIMGPGLVAVDAPGDDVFPVHLRERIRAAGPTVGPIAASPAPISVVEPPVPVAPDHGAGTAYRQNGFAASARA